MSEVRVNFLNWRPDLEPSAHDGLTEATNVIHDAEGYKPVRVQTAGAFSTTTPYQAASATFLSLQARPVGIGGDLVICALRKSDSVAIGPSFSVALLGSSTVLSSFSFPSTMLSANAARIVSFSVAELENHFVVTAQATGELEGGTTVALNNSVAVQYSLD